MEGLGFDPGDDSPLTFNVKYIYSLDSPILSLPRLADMQTADNCAE